MSIPSWIQSTTPPKQKGDPLYIDSWAKEHKWKDPYIFIIGAFLLILAIIALLIPILFRDSRKLPFGIIGIFLAYIALTYARFIICVMPFTIYEMGFTRTMVIPKLGRSRTEVFVPWDEISRVHIADGTLSGIPDHHYLHLVSRTSESQSVLLGPNGHGIEVPGIILELIPEKCDVSVREYLDR